MACRRERSGRTRTRNWQKVNRAGTRGRHAVFASQRRYSSGAAGAARRRHVIQAICAGRSAAPRNDRGRAVATNVCAAQVAYSSCSSRGGGEYGANRGALLHIAEHAEPMRHPLPAQACTGSKNRREEGRQGSRDMKQQEGKQEVEMLACCTAHHARSRQCEA